MYINQNSTNVLLQGYRSTAQRITIAALLLAVLACAVKSAPNSRNTEFVTVRDAGFYIGDEPYYFIGLNFWFGMHLGADNEYGDRERLVRELDRLQDMGVDNLRVLASGEGPDTEPFRVKPSVQPEPGVYNEEVLKGLDFLLAEMDKRGMRAVLVLNNFFQWSGGMAQYISWATGEPIPYPERDGNTWMDFMRNSARFYTFPEARQWFKEYVDMLIRRTNHITGRLYSEDPTIMSWQLANEPRGYEHPEEYADWVQNAAAFIKERAPKQLVSLGGEGKLIAGNENPLFEETGAYRELDYLTVHLWIENWSRYRPAEPETFIPATGFAFGYLADHIAAARALNKPLVLEEFGVSRDTRNYGPYTPVTFRDRFYTMVFEALLHLTLERSPLAGYNLWSWSGEGYPVEPGALWDLGDPLTGDPPHEHQGWYSIYEHDESTIQLIREYNERLRHIIR
jgi:mannan endo-1,4-beta-mannosidase